MADQLARGLFANFAANERPFAVPNGMEENLRHIDDHIGLYTLSAPVAPGTPYPPAPAPGDGQLYTDGSYAVFNGGSWKVYPARKGIRAGLANGTDHWVNSGAAWLEYGLIDTGPAIAGAIAALDAAAAPILSEAAGYKDQTFSYLQAYRATSYGALATDPLVDPNGAPPTVGDEYFNTTVNLLKRFNGATWQASDINTADLAAAGGASLIGSKLAAVGALACTQADRNERIISTRDFCAANGSDETASLQKAFAASENRAIWIHGEITTGPVNVSSNCVICFEPGARLKAKAGYGANDKLLNMIGVSNVVIFGVGGEVQMLKAEYTAGEQRHGLNIYNASNVVVYDLFVRDAGGDGVYIGGACENVSLVDVKADNSRRNNFTVTGGKRITLERCRATNATGTAPQCGYDIEPNSNSDFMEDITLRDCYSYNNAGGGYVVSPNALLGATAKRIKVDLINCVDDGSLGKGFEVSKSFVSTYTVSGSIVMSNCTARKTKESGFSVRNYDARCVPVHLIDCTVIDCSATVVSARYNAPFSVWSETTDTGATQVGNVHIVRPRIRYTGAAPAVPDFHFRALGAGQNVTNCEVLEPVEVGHAGTANWQYMANFTGATNCRFTDPNELYLHQNGSETLQDYYFGSTYKNDLGNPATFTLGAKSVGYPDQTFVVADANLVTVTPDAGSSIKPLGGVGVPVSCSQAGARLVLRRDSPTSWLVVSKVGDWLAAAGPGTKSGTFTMAAAPSKAVADTFVSPSSVIQVFPTNAAAAALMNGASSLYVSAKTASTSFTVATANAAAAAGTETFNYVIVNP